VIYPHDRPILRLGAPEGDEDEPKLLPGFSRPIMQRLRKAFTPKGLEFFNFYGLLKSINRGYPIPDDLRMQFRRATNRLNQITSPVDGKNVSPAITNQIAELRSDLNIHFARLVRQGMLSPTHWRQLNELFVPLLIQVARDKEIYLKPRQKGMERWAIFFPLSPKQQRREKMRDTDPESYALTVKRKKTLAEIDENIEAHMKAQGLVIERKPLAGKPILVGIDPKTKEHVILARDGTEFRGPPPVRVINPETGKEKWNWDGTAEQQYSQHMRGKDKARTRLALISTRTEVPLKKMRMLTEGEVDALDGDVQWDALTDDLAKQGKLTRVFPTKVTQVPILDEEGDVLRYEGVKVIVGGRYKGIFLDDMVNGLGRMIEGTAYTYSPISGRKGKAPKRIDPAQREPYTTVADMTETMVIKGKRVKKKTKKLFMRISGRNTDKEIRDAIKALACNVPSPKGNCIQSISYHKVPGSRAAEFYFDPKDYATIMDNLAGMSLSQSAMEMMQKYTQEQAYSDRATTEENLPHYTAEAIGGFRPRTKLIDKQKQALAWLDANGGSGVCALDTGIGKTLTAIAAMQKLLRDGMAEEGASYTTPDGEEIETNGRFLYVCPRHLKGNLPSQAVKFMSDPAALRERVDIMDYKEFGRAQKHGRIPKNSRLRKQQFWKDRGYRFDAKFYISIYFDEAHQLKGTNQASKAALKLWHPRKVCFTASPMDKEPMEAYILAAVSNNIRTFSLPGDNAAQTQAVREAQAVKRRFKKRYCETVGGDVVGVKEDPSLKRELDQWVKRNVFYAEKSDVVDPEGKVLDKPTRTPVAIEMDPTVQNAYQTLTRQFSKTMFGLAKKWTEGGGAGTGGEDVKRFARLEFRPVVKLMRDLSNRPEKALETIATMVGTNRMPDGEPIPRILSRVVTKWRKMATEAELREVARQMENPKLQEAERIVTQKLAQTQRGPNPSRALLFADDPEFCMDAVKFLGQKMGGKVAVALKDKIYIYQGTTPLKEVVFERTPSMRDRLVKSVTKADFDKGGKVSVIPLPLRKKKYKPHPLVRRNMTDNKYYRPDMWQSFAFEQVIGPDQGIKAVVLLGSEYAYGLNLQMFDTVIHLDRDSAQSETMKQRTARAWRQGQKNPVDEFTLDATYSADDDDGKPRDEHDLTLDQIKAAQQAVGKKVFDDIMIESMKTELGGKWAEMVQRDASLADLDDKVAELMMSPFVGKSGEA